MSDEIKEIINNLRKIADNSIFVVCSSQEELDKIPKYTANFLSVNDRQAKILLDYITNLQEENEDLREENKEAHDFDETMKDIKDNLIARINRQECEIHNLKAKLEMYENGVYFSSENDKLQQRIDKAIEYLDKFYDEESNHWKYDFDNTNKQELYEILKGIDKE